MSQKRGRDHLQGRNRAHKVRQCLVEAARVGRHGDGGVAGRADAQARDAGGVSWRGRRCARALAMSCVMLNIKPPNGIRRRRNISLKRCHEQGGRRSDARVSLRRLRALDEARPDGLAWQASAPSTPTTATTSRTPRSAALRLRARARSSDAVRRLLRDCSEVSRGLTSASSAWARPWIAPPAAAWAQRGPASMGYATAWPPPRRHA